MADIRITPAASVMAFTSSLGYKETLTQDSSGNLTLLGSGSTGRTDIFTVNGNNGTLFSVSDDLSNSLFSVNTIAGLPVIEAFADNSIIMGAYGQNVMVVTGSRVGVRTSSPQSSFHVDGDLTVSTGSQASQVINLLSNSSGSGFGTAGPQSGTGVQWGAYNLDPGTFGLSSYIDCSITLGPPSIIGYFGSSILFKTQTVESYTPAEPTPQKTQLGIYPGSFLFQRSGVGIGTTTPRAPLSVVLTGVPPVYQTYYYVASFDADYGAVKFPNVTQDNINMMLVENGSVVYNSSTNKLQVYANGTWVNLH